MAEMTTAAETKEAGFSTPAAKSAASGRNDEVLQARERGGAEGQGDESSQAQDLGEIGPCSAGEVLEHWLGHRRLTRKVIEVFPEDQLFTFSIGGMRPFGVLVHEFFGMAVPVVNQVASGTWGDAVGEKPTDKAGVLRLWDEQTEQVKAVFATIAPERFHARIKIYEQWEVSGMEAIQYTVDNEIHHRGQGYVYLRALGVEPPAFYDRS